MTGIGAVPAPRSPRVEYAIDPPATCAAFEVRLRLLHRVRTYLDDLCRKLRTTHEGRELYHDLLGTANRLERDLPRLADPVDELMRRWLGELDDATPPDDDRGRDAEYLRTRLPWIRKALSDTKDTVAPVDQAFADICDQAEAAYRDGYRRAGAGGAVPQQGRGGWVPPRLVVKPLGAMPREDRYALDGRCRRSTGTGGAPQVEVAVHVKSFGPESFAALPYVLAHEVMCHAPAAHTGNERLSPFAEGMMDWVAWEHLKRWMHGIDRAWQRAAEKHGGLLRDALTEWPSSSPNRLIGLDAADWLNDWYGDAEHLGLHPKDCWRHVATLAVALNVVDRPLEEKDALIVHLNGDRLPAGLAGALTRWVDGTASAAEVLDAALRERV